MSTCVCKVERTETTITDTAGNVISASKKVTVNHVVNPACPDHGGEKMLDLPPLPKIKIEWPR